jgi:hypothetical protein
MPQEAHRAIFCASVGKLLSRTSPCGALWAFCEAGRGKLGWMWRCCALQDLVEMGKSTGSTALRTRGGNRICVNLRPAMAGRLLHCSHDGEFLLRSKSFFPCSPLMSAAANPPYISLAAAKPPTTVGQVDRGSSNHISIRTSSPQAFRSPVLDNLSGLPATKRDLHHLQSSSDTFPRRGLPDARPTLSAKSAVKFTHMGAGVRADAYWFTNNSSEVSHTREPSQHLW